MLTPHVGSAHATRGVGNRYTWRRQIRRVAGSFPSLQKVTKRKRSGGIRDNLHAALLADADAFGTAIHRREVVAEEGAGRLIELSEIFLRRMPREDGEIVRVFLVISHVFVPPKHDEA